jgi:hypothetical protein
MFMSGMNPALIVHGQHDRDRTAVLREGVQLARDAVGLADPPDVAMLNALAFVAMFIIGGLSASGRLRRHDI